MLYGILMPHHRDARPALRHTLQQLTVTAETWGRTSSQDTEV